MKSRWIVFGLVLLCLTEVWCKPASDKESEDEDTDYPGDERPDDDPDDSDTSHSDLPVQALTKSMQFNFAPGSTVYLPCQFANAEDKMINWLRDQDLLYAGEIRLAQDEERLELLPNNTLVIKNAMPQDSSDRYICQALVDQGESVEIVHRVRIAEPQSGGSPLVRVFPSNHVEILNGEDVTIGCEADKKIKKDGIFFSREGVRIKVDEQDDHSIHLKIRNATRHLAGDYQCVVETGDEKPLISHIKLRVKHVPEIEYEKDHRGEDKPRVHSHYYTGLGIETNISCVIHSHPPVTKLHWIKDGQKLKMDNRLSKSDGRKSHHVLTIKNTSKADLGSYHCHAWNDLGDAIGPEIYLSDTPSQPIFKKGDVADDAILFLWEVISYKPIVETQFLYRKVDDDQWHESQDVQIIKSIDKKQMIRTTIRGIKAGKHEAVLRARNDEEHSNGDGQSKWGPYSEIKRFDGEYKNEVAAESVKDSAVTSSLSLMTLLLVILPFAFCWKL